MGDNYYCYWLMKGNIINLPFGFSCSRTIFVLICLKPYLRENICWEIFSLHAIDTSQIDLRHGYSSIWISYDCQCDRYCFCLSLTSMEALWGLWLQSLGSFMIVPNSDCSVRQCTSRLGFFSLEVLTCNNL